jgi:hypothetical protein
MDNRNPDRSRGLIALRVILAFSLVSTTLHYTHNTLAIDQYPKVPGLPDPLAQAIVAGGWVVFTACGILGYRRYVQQRFWAARGWLLAYSLSGLASLGHFLVGPLTIPAFWYATVVTDGLASMLLWAFVVWSAVVLPDGSRVPVDSR